MLSFEHKRITAQENTCSESKKLQSMKICLNLNLNRDFKLAIYIGIPADHISVSRDDREITKSTLAGFRFLREEHCLRVTIFQERKERGVALIYKSSISINLSQ